MKIECFANYTAEELILDNDFIEIVRNPERMGELEDLVESFPEKRYEINLAVEVVRRLHVTKFQQPVHRKKELWNQIVTKQKKHIHFTYIRYAAAILFLIGAGSAFYFFNAQSTQSELAEDLNSNSALIGNEDDVLLVLSNGKTVSIDSKESTVRYSEDGSEIKVNETESIAQDVVGEGVNKMIVPFGKRSTVTLSDGTKVWLNSGSTLVFPPAFVKKSRKVRLMGEAFFDVTHNKQKPFFVKTNAFEMKVYGTRFDIQSYKQDNASSVILVEGLVSMRSKDSRSKEVFLSPSQRGTMVDGSKNIQIDNIENVDDYTSWTDGYLSFSGKELTDVLKQVSRYYNVNIDVATTKKVDKIYGKMDLKENVEKVLDGVSFISNTKFRKVGDGYEFYQ